MKTYCSRRAKPNTSKPARLKKCYGALAIVRAMGMAASILFLVACAGTASPSPITAAVPSPDPGGNHSGVYAVMFVPDPATLKPTIKAQLWYPADRTLYNALIAKYAKTYTTPLTADYHLTTTYPLVGWYSPQGLPKNGTPTWGQLQPVYGLSGYWEADTTAIGVYIDLLRKNRPVQ